MTGITDESRREFAENGVICLRKAFDRRWLDPIAEDIERILADPGAFGADQSIPSPSGRFFNGFFQWLRSEGIRDFVTRSPAARIAAELLDAPAVRFFYDQLLVKEPRTPQPTPWHTDADYFPIKGKGILSIWTPLDPARRENGTLRFLKGSHREKLVDLVHRAGNRPSVDRDKGMYVLPDFHLFPDEFEFVSWDLEPGDCLVFHIDVVHFAYGNDSDSRRRALSTRWFDESCTVDESRPHILQKPNIVRWLERCGERWDGRIDDRLFPRFSP